MWVRHGSRPQLRPDDDEERSPTLLLIDGCGCDGGADRARADTRVSSGVVVSTAPLENDRLRIAGAGDWDVRFWSLAILG